MFLVGWICFFWRLSWIYAAFFKGVVGRERDDFRLLVGGLLLLLFCSGFSVAFVMVLSTSFAVREVFPSTSSRRVVLIASSSSEAEF